MGGSSSITYSSLQVQSLMDHPEKWYKASMREAYKNIPTGMRSVMNSYVHNMIEARSMFNDGFLTSLGYNPRESIKYRVVDPDLVLSWARSNISSVVSSVSEYKFATPTMEELALEYLQYNYSGMNLADKSFLISGVRWYLSGVTVVSAFGSNATCYEDKTVTVTSYAVSNGVTVVSISDTIISINGVNYWSAILSSGSAKIPVKYTTIACPGINSDIINSIILTYDGKEYLCEEVYEESLVYSTKIVVSVKLDVSGELVVTGKNKDTSYDVWSPRFYTMITKGKIEEIVGQVKSEIATTMSGLVERLIFKYVLNGTEKIMVAEISEEMVSGLANAKAYPIIPLRENYAFTNENSNMKTILNKLGMSKDDFEKSLDDSRIKNAAILFVVDIEDSSKAGNKYIFETLVNMVTTTTIGPKNSEETTYHLDYGFSDVDMKTKVSFSIKFVDGNVAEVGEYVRDSVSESSQARDTETNAIVTAIDTYQVIRKQVNEIYYQELKIIWSNTKWEVGGYKIDGEATYIPVVDIGLETLNYEDLCYILALSTSIMTTAITTVKTKWYQSGFFKFIMIIAVVALTIVTAGAASPWLAPLIYAAGAVSVMQIMGINTGTLGQIIQVAGIIAGGYTAAVDQVGTQAVLTTADTLVKLAAIASEINLQGVLESIESKRSAKQAELEASGEKIQEMYDSMQNGLWMGVSDRNPDMLYAMSSTQMMCNYDVLYDYDGLIDRQVKSVGI